MAGFRKKRRQLTPRQRIERTVERAFLTYRRARVAIRKLRRDPDARDRATAMATFAFIGLFAVGSVDAIITGRADFGPSAAYAEDYAPGRVVAAPLAAAQQPVELPPELKPSAKENRDYSRTSETLLGGPYLVEGPRDGEASDFEPEDTFAAFDPQDGAPW